MNNSEEIDSILANGWKEYPINKILDTHDRSFFRKFGRFQVELRLWDFTRYNHPIGWDIAGRLGKLCLQISTNMETLDKDISNMIGLLSKYVEMNPSAIDA